MFYKVQEYNPMLFAIMYETEKMMSDHEYIGL